MTKTRKHSFIKVVLALTLAITGCTAFYGCSGNANSSSTTLANTGKSDSAKSEEFMTQGKGEHLVIGRRLKLAKMAPSVIAEKLGYFTEEGCDVEFQQLDLAEGFAALATGNIDGMLNGVVQSCEYIAKGSPIYMFGGTVLNGTEILAKDDFNATFSKPEDFKGYKIGFHRPETGQIMFRAWLKDAGLDIEGGDVTFVPIDNEQAEVEAILKGEVDMALTNNAFGYINKDRGIKVAGTVKDLTGDYPCCRQNASENAYKNKYLSLVDFEIALLRGYKVFRENPEQAIPIIAEYAEQSEDFVKASLYGTEDYEAVMNLSPDPCTKAVAEFYESLKTVEQIDSKTAPSVEEFAVSDIYRKALDTLMQREPNEKFWKDLDATYKQNN